MGIFQQNKYDFDSDGNAHLKTSVIQPLSTQEKLKQQIRYIALDSVEHINDAIEACKALIRIINNGGEHALPSRFSGPCNAIIKIFDDFDGDDDAYTELLIETKNKLAGDLHWFSLFIGVELDENQRLLVNAKELYPYYLKGAFTVQQLLSVNAHQRVNLFDFDVLEAIVDQRLSFDQAMKLSFNEREQLAHQEYQRSLSWTK